MREEKVIRKVKMVRSWDKGIFTYYKVYSDGVIVESNRKEADQYTKVHGVKPTTITGKPEESLWNTIGN